MFMSSFSFAIFLLESRLGQTLYIYTLDLSFKYTLKKSVSQKLHFMFLKGKCFQKSAFSQDLSKTEKLCHFGCHYSK